QLEAVRACEQVATVLEEHVDEEVEAPRVVAVRLNRHRDASRLQLSAGRGLLEEQVERPGMRMVVEMAEVLPVLAERRRRHNGPVLEVHRHLDERVVVLVLVVRLELDARPGQRRIVTCRHLDLLYSIPTFSSRSNSLSSMPFARASRWLPS